MSQSKLSSYYTTRKKRSDNKLVKSIRTSAKEVKSQQIIPSNVISKLTDAQLIKPVKLPHSPSKLKKLGDFEPPVNDDFLEETSKNVTTNKPKVIKKPPKSTKPKAQSKSKKQTKATKTAAKSSDIRLSFQMQKDKSQIAEDKLENIKTILNTTYTIEKETIPESVGKEIILESVEKETIPESVEKETIPESVENLLRSPKRNLHNTEKESDSAKKRKQELSTNLSACTINKEVKSNTPYKHIEVKAARKTLFKNCESKSHKNLLEGIKPIDQDLSSKSGNQSISPASLMKLEFLKDKLSKFDQTYKKIKEFKTNKCKITSVISLDIHKKTDVEDTKEEEKPTTPAYIKYHNLAEPNNIEIKKDVVDPNLLENLTLPFKYKILSRTFQCSDTVVNMLHSREEVCTFNKLKNGVQDMTKRNFTKSHLGQIKTVFPLAYNYHIDKNSAAVRNRNPGTPLYELVVAPNLKEVSLDLKRNSISKSSTSDKTLKSKAFIPMTPALLIERKHSFVSHLLKITLKHHQNFLARLNPPVIVPISKITKWHPKFNIDSVPDIEPSELPEPPDQPIVHSAKDILNKLKGTADEKVIKALQKVSVETEQRTDKKKEEPETKPKITNRLLKNISDDILARVRARESAKIVEDMTKAPKDKKRIEMLERLPELIRILRTYFITERRAAISIEEAVQKIMDSYHSLMNPEDIKQHLQLIADTFPKWLSLIPIRKGLFLKIDKSKDINTLLNNIPLE